MASASEESYNIFGYLIKAVLKKNYFLKLKGFQCPIKILVI